MSLSICYTPTYILWDLHFCLGLGLLVYNKALKNPENPSLWMIPAFGLESVNRIYLAVLGCLGNVKVFGDDAARYRI